MNAVVMRPYAGESDLLAMQSLLREAPSPYDIYPTASDLVELLDPTVSGTPDHSAVWEDATQNVVGFAIVSQFQNLHARFNPREWIEAAGAELIGRAVETEEHRISLMRQPHYRQDLDLVAAAPAGALAAFCVSSIDPAENERRGQNEGEIAIVGTHPAYRGHGLGRAVVLAGMHGLRRDGAETAVLGVAGDNTAAIRVYERLGFSVDSQIRWYEKPVDSATC